MKAKGLMAKSAITIAALLMAAGGGSAVWAASADEILVDTEVMEQGEASKSGYIPVLTDGSQYAAEQDGESLRRAASLPAAYDLRNQQAVTPVKSQAESSLCWAYSAIASAESGLLHNRVSSPAALDLSEFHLGWTTFNGKNGDVSDPTRDETFQTISGENWQTNGGNRYYSVGTLARWYGAETEANIGGNPNAGNRRNSISHLKNAYFLPELNSYTVYSDGRVHNGYYESARNDIKQMIMDKGAVEVGIKIVNSARDYTDTYYCSDSYDCVADHSVVLVGWDDNRVTSAPQPGAWLFKNSWGETGNDGGYFYVSYYDKSLDNPTFYELENTVNGAHEYQSNYQYDGTGGGFARYKASDYAMSGANVFTAQARQDIGRVGFYVMEAGTNYTIEVYRGLTGSKPNSGTRVLRMSGREAYAGYHTVDLSQDVTVNAGEKFAVVVTMEANGVYSVPTEWNSTGAKYITYNPGESFVSSSTGNWVDVQNVNRGADSCNICIKAFANPSTKKPGHWVESAQGWWYDNEDGTYPVSCWQKIDGIWYLFDQNGYIYTGWQMIGNDWYYLNGNGAMVTGWLNDGGIWYYLYDNGAMATGWQQVGSDWYFMNGNGTMATGWQIVGNDWHYLTGNGAMVTGWLNDGGIWYYLYNNGAMATGWQFVGNDWYYLSGNGTMAAGWQQVGDYWYYLNGNGAMLTGWLNDGGIWYYLTESGAMVTNWNQVNDLWYYFDPNGAMAADTWIDSYYVNSNGVWV